MNVRTVAVALVLTAALIGCGEDAASTQGSEAAEAARGFAFPTGDFQFTTTAIDDGCLEGAMNLLFMPNGSSTPWDWTYPVKIHDPGELPKSYEVQFRDPFGPMTMTVVAVDERTERALGANPGLLLSSDFSGECRGDMAVDVELRLISTDRVEGTGRLTMTNLGGSDECPSDAPTECVVLQSIEARRL